MRGSDAVSGKLFSYVNLEKRVPADHPLRAIRKIVNATLVAMSAEFDALYSPFGRESIPPERLLRALLLQAFYTIRSERQLVERIDFDLLFGWFVGLGMDDPVWDATTFTKNRDRLLDGDIATKFLAAVLAQPEVAALLSDEHFSVDGTLLVGFAATASLVSCAALICFVSRCSSVLGLSARWLRAVHVPVVGLPARKMKADTAVLDKEKGECASTVVRRLGR